jgi:hypothetical protein
MNTIKIIYNKFKPALHAISVIFLAISVFGCDDYLMEKEIPRITVDFYKTQQGVDAAATAAYGYLRFGITGEFSNILNELGNDLTTGATGAVGYPCNIYNSQLSSSLSNFRSLWENHYKGINTTNLVLQEVSGGPMSENDKKMAIAEMSFLRAYFYFDLVQQFGAIPLVTEASYDVRTDFKRSPVSEVYKLIISDLRYAVENLRESTSTAQKNVGKATRYSAAHLLSKAYLTRCSAVTDQRGQLTTDPDSALYYADMVIKNTNYKLQVNFADLWRFDNQANSEVVFAVQFTQDIVYNGSGNLSHLYYGSWYEDITGLQRDIENGRPYRFHMGTPRTMYDLYDRKNDSRYYKTFKWVYYCNKANNKVAIGDTALYYSINPAPAGETYQYTYIAWDRDVFNNNNQHYPSILKFIDPGRPSMNETKGSRDWVRMRLGETYLLAAEAAGRKGDFEKAAEYINVVRQRAAWHDGEAKMSQYWKEEGGEYGNTKSTYEQIKVAANDLRTNFVDFILDERGRELLGEYMRWEDLVRCEKLYEYIHDRKYNPNADAQANIQPYHKLRPIPQTHIDRLIPQGKIEEEQNPGYY